MKATGSSASRVLALLAWAALPLLCLAVYAPALHGERLWDDETWAANPLLESPAGLLRIWTDPAEIPVEEHYWPVLYTAFWIEHALWGRAPLGYHLASVALHSLCALLAWRVLRALRVPGAWLAGALFAVHPVHVESVAWMSIQKNPLSGALSLGAALAYLAYDAHGRERARAAALALLALALLAKSAAIALPAGLVVALWLRHGRLGARELVPLAPLFVVALGLAAVDFAWLRAHGEPFELGFSALERTGLAGAALAHQASKAFVPVGLMPLYPLWDPGPGGWIALAAAALLCVALWRARARLGRGPLAAALWFILHLAPTLGIVEYSFMQHALAADRYQYLAVLGPIALAAAAGCALAARLRVAPGLRAALAAAALALLGTLAWRLAHHYVDSAAYARFAAEQNPGSWTARRLRGEALRNRGEWTEAEVELEAALRLQPGRADLHNDLAQCVLRRGDVAQGIALLERAIELEPRMQKAHYNLGLVLREQGDFPGAIRVLERALELEPSWVDAHNDLGVTLARSGRLPEALACFRAALAIDPGRLDVQRNLKTAVELGGE